MNKRLVLLSGVGVLALGALGFGAWLLSLPPTPPPTGHRGGGFHPLATCNPR